MSIGKEDQGTCSSGISDIYKVMELRVNELHISLADSFVSDLLKIGTKRAFNQVSLRERGTQLTSVCGQSLKAHADEFTFYEANT